MITKELRKTPDIYPLRHIRVIDGDTIEAEILLPFDVVITKRIRLKGWWAPEMEGQFRSDGLTARFLVERYCEGKALWLHSPTCRLDRYGRVIGHLMHGTKIVPAAEVLGHLQLSEAEHKRRRDASKSNARAIAAWPGGDPHVTIAGSQSGCILGHPRDTSGIDALAQCDPQADRSGPT